MTKAELIETVSEKTGLIKKDVELILESSLECIMGALKAGNEVTLTGFGTFMAKVRAARMGVDPRNPEQRIQIPQVTVPKFKAGKALKEALKN